ncbi:hypothetical protein [Miltoncostaea marina]|uniref:hypothetical protein n=1 Tax=Miltoncostaea marina TaxID=2843215 RepID=UPI001C3CAE69|nr:hypothetical protein [Miltoncostaea marina]
MEPVRTDGLGGRWALARESGMLPPLGLLHKRIAGSRGATALGRLPGIPFRVRHGPAGPELVYAGPLRALRDRLTPRPDGGWDGVATFLGLPLGRFSMTRPGALSRRSASRRRGSAGRRGR